MKKLITVLSLGAFALGYSQSASYSDYQRSITDVNWETVAANLLLSPQQKSDLFSLNNQYTDYNSWNNKYGNNPDQWTTDRYSSIQRIMGQDKYVKFKNKYYKGQNPVAVYNRNKNNHKKAQVKKYSSIQSKRAQQSVNGHNTKRTYQYTNGNKSHGKANVNHQNAGKKNGKGHK
ncbi:MULTISPECIES: hypothetical protein [Chryseobacterium]|uniref:DUF3106 domain-containing protein n=1 Tax=Chryseobacterium salivictor TaxID=2547600 RepID=A0A4P6ZFI1_9FLAO|nr:MULTISPECIES: hypothetical protein [Chryseobacterium]MDQ0478046.1 hypothetical protein [Chryseobacterium sp. MDT2-18]QBO58275.1 hypothetical protein NBC122_01454 [Chryseobacterium salivictor]